MTSGEPAGIGPELCLALAGQPWPARLAFAADPRLLAERAALLGLTVDIATLAADEAPPPHTPGRLAVAPSALAAPAQCGRLDLANARYVLALLDAAVDGCRRGRFDGMVTAPVQKSLINEAGVPFSGHTEYLAERCGVATPVMMLVSGRLRVALATTHLPLAAVPAALTQQRLSAVIEVLHADLRRLFGLTRPVVQVLGLNPHAGEGGHLGREEIDVIGPVLQRLRERGWSLRGPVPADTAFTSQALDGVDAVLAMYHDQGLPVLKHAGFGDAVNVTLGLPMLRTSVDHGTALALAGTGRADPGSLASALRLAIELAARRA